MSLFCCCKVGRLDGLIAGGAGTDLRLQLSQFVRRVVQMPERQRDLADFRVRDVGFLKSLDSAGPQKDYEALRAVLGRRPSLSEFYRSGSSLQDMRRQAGHWFALVHSMGDLSAVETDVADRFQALLREVETTAMTKSFKAVTLEAWLEQDGLSQPVALAALAAYSRTVMDRRRPLLHDLDAHMRIAAPTD